MSASTSSERHSPLHAVHVAAGASFTDFAGWQMPVRYTSDLAEHHAVRTAAGIFDLSHMAEIAVRGTGAAAALDYALAGRLSALAIGQAKYSLLLTPDGGIVDDVVVYRLADDDFLVVANASNRAVAVSELTGRAAAFDARVVDESDATALLAVQGPESRGILERVAGLDAGTELAELRYYRIATARFADRPVLVARTGYTGEDGFELYVPVDAAESLWTAIVQAGGGAGLVPAGLASRDTLRLEAGMPLYGSELGRDIFPAQAGLGRVVNLAKDTDFVGRHASENGPDAVARVLVGLASEGRRAGRAGYPVYASGDAEAVMEALEGAVDPAGIVTSGALSPTLGHPIAMAYVDPAVARPGTTVYIDVRGTRIPATVVSLPFYTRAS